MKSTLKYMAAVLLITGCTAGNKHIEKQMDAAIKACKTKDCVVKLSDVTDFKWDTVYLFNSAIPKEMIEQALQRPYDNYKEGERPMIFVVGDKIVYSENNAGSVQKLEDGQLIFDYPVGVRYYKFTPQYAAFKIKHADTLKGKSIYELTPL